LEKKRKKEEAKREREEGEDAEEGSADGEGTCDCEICVLRSHQQPPHPVLKSCKRQRALFDCHPAFESISNLLTEQQTGERGAKEKKSNTRLRGHRNVEPTRSRRLKVRGVAIVDGVICCASVLRCLVVLSSLVSESTAWFSHD